MYILHVTYKVKEGMRDAFLAKLAELQVAEKSRQETGNVEYRYFLPVDSCSQVLLVEIWDGAAAQEAHTHTAHFQALAAVKNEFVENTVLERFDGAKRTM